MHHIGFFMAGIAAECYASAIKQNAEDQAIGKTCVVQCGDVRKYGLQCADLKVPINATEVRDAATHFFGISF